MVFIKQKTPKKNLKYLQIINFKRFLEKTRLLVLIYLNIIQQLSMTEIIIQVLVASSA